MAARSPTSTPPSTSVQATNNYFLGIELANEQLRAALVDDQLSTIGIETFDFDSELPEYQLVSASDASSFPLRADFS